MLKLGKVEEAQLDWLTVGIHPTPKRHTAPRGGAVAHGEATIRQHNGRKEVLTLETLVELLDEIGEAALESCRHEIRVGNDVVVAARGLTNKQRTILINSEY